MASRKYYVTLNGQPPNGGVPPGTAFFGQVATPDPPAPPPYQPLVVVAPAPPPATLTIQPLPSLAFFVPVAASASASPPPPPSPAPPPAQPSETYEIPGIMMDGATFVQDGKAYIFTENNTIINFLHDGTRPFDGGQGSILKFAALKVPTLMTVADLIRRLGVPKDDNDRFGIVECIEQGNGYWAKGITYILSADKSKKTLQEICWDESRGTTHKPVWIAIHDKTRHGPA